MYFVLHIYEYREADDTDEALEIQTPMKKKMETAAGEIAQFYGILLNSVHAALAIVKDKEENTCREIDRVKLVLKLLQENEDKGNATIIKHFPVYELSVWVRVRVRIRSYSLSVIFKTICNYPISCEVFQSAIYYIYLQNTETKLICVVIFFTLSKLSHSF